MAKADGIERSLEDTSTWAVAVVCLVMVAISLLLEHLLHIIEKWLHKTHKRALLEALEKVKSELMLMGFISLLLTVGQGPITNICISPDIASSWLPCKKGKSLGNTKGLRRLLEFSYSGEINRRILAEATIDKCSAKGKVAFVSAYGIDQLHYFIFVLAVFHIFYCIITYILGRTKMRRWKSWEEETKTLEYQYHNDPERFRFTRDTTFGRRHLKSWSRSPVFLWIVCFFRQFFGLTKVDYLTLRHGFIMAHLTPESHTKFDFQKYISRSLEDDFKAVVGISPIMWLVALFLLLTNTYSWNSYLWLPFISLIIVLLVGTKLQLIITQMGLRIQERGDVVKGAPVVQPGDELFWFGRPRLILFLIRLVLFQNAFELAYFIWSMWKLGISSCVHDRIEDIIIRSTMGVIIQVLCSYVTLPLYALVTQMGSSMRSTIFNDRVAAALKNWRRTAKRNTKHSKHSESNSHSHTPTSSRTPTPSYGMSPVHLLHNHRSSSTAPNFDNDQWDPEALDYMHYHYHEAEDSSHGGDNPDVVGEEQVSMEEPTLTQLPLASGSVHDQHEMVDFTFRK